MSEYMSWREHEARRYAASPYAPPQPSKGTFIDDLNQAARENPVSAALIGAGILLMFVGTGRVLGGAGAAAGAVGRGTQAAAGTVSSGVQQAASGVGHAASAAASGVRQAASAVADGIGSVAQVVGSAAGSVAGGAVDAARSMASGAADLASGAADWTSDAAGRAYQSGSDAAARTAGSAGDISRGAQARVSEWGSGARQGLAESFEQQPLLLGAVGLMIGAAAAAALPVTDAERRMLGETSDGFKDMVNDLVARKTEQAKDMARSAISEAEAQGLTPQAASHAVQDLVDKLGTVADKTQTAAKERISEAMSSGSTPR